MPGPSQDLRRHLHELAFSQAGYFTAAQALEVGYSYQAQKYHADHGNWVRVDRGLFRLPGWPVTEEDPYARWVLWSGNRGVVSHDSALSVLRLSDANPSRIHLTVPEGFRARDDAVVLHFDEIADADREAKGSWQVTTPERTIADVAGGELPQDIVDQAVADALRVGQVTRRRLLRRAANASDRAALRLERALTTLEST